MWELVSENFYVFLGTLISTVFGVFFVKYIIKRKTYANLVISIILILLLPLIATILRALNYSLIKTIISYLLFVILFKYIFNLSFYEAILCSLAFMLLLTISEILVFIISTKCLNISETYLYGSLSGSVLGNFIVSFFALLLSFFLKRPLRTIINTKLKNYIPFYVTLLFACVIFFFYVTFSNIGNGISLFSGLTVVCILLVIISILLYQAYKNNELMIKYDRLLEFIKKYEIEIDNQRMMRHEIKNQLLTIKSKIVDKDREENIINYIDEIIEDNNKEINHVLYAKLNCLPPNGIKGLFYFKVSEAISQKIDVDINISKSIERSFIKRLDSGMFNQLGKILGIFLDNAIEGTANCKEKSLGIEVYLNNDDVCFIISNTYCGRDIFKGVNRGHGLLLAKSIIDKNNCFENFTEVTDELYVQKLIVKKEDTIN